MNEDNTPPPSGAASEGPEVPRTPSGARDWDAWSEHLAEADYPGPDGPDQTAATDPTGPAPEGPTGPAGEKATGRGRGGGPVGEDGPVLVDSVGAQQVRTGPAEVRPVFPDWAKSRSALAYEAGRAVRLALHRIAYHAVRLPLYAAKVALYAPRGAFRLAAAWGRWCFDEEGRPLRSATAARDDYEAYRKLVLVRDRHVRWRGLVSAALGTVGAVGILAVIGMGGAWAWGLGAITVAALGYAGRPGDRPLLGTATHKAQVVAPTSETVVRALCSLGIAGIASAVAKHPGAVAFPVPIARDGKGYRVTVDLPYGVTAAEVCERRDKLASGLTQPLGCVWPEGQPEVHPRRLVIWIGDENLSASKPVAWPLAKKGTVDLFDAFPLGVDPRGREVRASLFETNWLIGAIPGMGKTFVAKIPVLAAGLDPRAEVWIGEHKGSGDLAFAEAYAARYVSGVDDESIAQTFRSLEDLLAEIERRAKVIKDLPRDLAPDNKVTPELAANKKLGLHPLVMVIDEAQELFTHPEFGKAAGEMAVRAIKRGRAFFVTLVLATQKPDSASLPTGVSSNVGTRIALRVMDQQSNDMILGTSAYKNGIRSTLFTGRDRGLFYLVGAADEPQVVKGAFIDGPAAEAIAARARALRETAGTLTGYAAGQQTQNAAKPQFDLAADLLAAWPAGVKSAWNAELVDALADLRPETYGTWADLDEEHKTAQLTRSLRACGAHELVKQIGRRDGKGKTINRRGIAAGDLRIFVTERDQKKGA